eukprot:7845747-Alexandrium_andersonii.AAC.1
MDDELLGEASGEEKGLGSDEEPPERQGRGRAAGGRGGRASKESSRGRPNHNPECLLSGCCEPKKKGARWCTVHARVYENA